jgi:ATP-dependent helicase/nuclease subunit A
MLALLRWLWQPGDDLALAQVLKSPLFLGADEGLALLARGREASLWDRLSMLFGDPLADPLGPAADAFARADDATNRAASRGRTTRCCAGGRWCASRGARPVDRVIADRDAYARYAAVVPPAQREVVRANLDALLALRAGRRRRPLAQPAASWPR